MESMELFDKTYYGAQNQEEFESIMRTLGWRRSDYGIMDFPKSYPCLFAVVVERSGGGQEYPDVYYYTEDDIQQFAIRIQSLL